MKKGETVTYEKLGSAFMSVQAELGALGVWHPRSRLRKTDVVLCRAPQLLAPAAAGFCYDTAPLPWWARMLGYKAGNVYVPRVVPAQLWNQNRGSLRGVIRHELAHAVAYWYPKYVRHSRRFQEAFVGRYDWKAPMLLMPGRSYVSVYALLGGPGEDFAETFSYYVTNRGNSRIKGRHPMMMKKFRYVRWLIRTLSR